MTMHPKHDPKRKDECLGCIGITDDHTCPGHSDFLKMKAVKDSGNCYKCWVKDKRIAELEAKTQEKDDET